MMIDRQSDIEEFHRKGIDPNRKDQSKRQWHLLPMQLISGVIDVFQAAIDSGKYKAFSWMEMKAPNITCENSLKRHQEKIEGGEIFDDETGLMHIDHQIANLIIKKYHMMKQLEKDSELLERRVIDTGDLIRYRMRHIENPNEESEIEKKYEFVEEEQLGSLRRIRAIRDFGNVKSGDLGGFIEHEKNLSHDGNCWVYDDAIVCGTAVIAGNVIIDGYQIFSGSLLKKEMGIDHE